MSATAEAAVAYSIDTAAALVGISAKTLRRAIDDGQLVARYVTPALRVVERAELEAWVASLPTESPRRGRAP